MRNFSDLTEREVLALAIANEEEDGRIYPDFAEGLRDDYPARAKVFTEMAAEEDEHRRWLIELYRQKFGEHIPLIKRAGRARLRPAQAGLADCSRSTSTRCADQAAEMERRRRAVLSARRRPHDRRLDPPAARRPGRRRGEARDGGRADHAGEPDRRARGPRRRESARRMLVLRFIQPGLAGLMDGSVSTLAPVFAAAFATGASWEAFLVGMAASIGAGISMGFAEALSDNGSLTGRGAPLAARRGLRADDHAGRHRPHAAVPDPQFPDRHRRGGRGGGGRNSR